MTDVKWSIKAREFVNCNCSYGCPCQFNAGPSYGHCEAVSAMQIDEGIHGTTRLDGLRFVGIFRWPGAIHEGKGEAAVVIDKRAGLPIDQRHSLAIHNASGHERANFAVTHDAANSTVLHVTSVHLLSEPCMIY